MAKSALAKSGVDTGLVQPKSEKTNAAKPAVYPVVDNGNDYFVERDGVKFAGMHLLLELWDAENLDDPAKIEPALTAAAEAAAMVQTTVLPRAGFKPSVKLSSRSKRHLWRHRPGGHQG